MKKFITYIYIACLLAIFSELQGQTVLVTHDRTITQIKNLKTFEGYYQYVLAESNINMYIPKDEVSYIEEYTGVLSDYKNPRIFENQQSLAIKFSPSGLTAGSIILSIEKSMTPKLLLEVDIKYHNRALNEYHLEDISGWGMNAGIKFRLNNPFHLSDDNKYNHIMKGPYLKPTIGYSYRKELSYHGLDKYKIVYGGLNTGYQLILKDKLIIDLFAGVYLYTGKQNTTPPHEQFTIPSRIKINEGDFMGKNNFAQSIGIKIGILL